MVALCTLCFLYLKPLVQDVFITISEVVRGPPDLAVYSGYSEEEVAAGPGRWEKSVENDHPSTEVSSLIDHSPLMV